VPAGDLTYWLAWGLGALVICLGVAATWWGLFGDRARGRRRCPRCWHDLSHTPGMTCSECGYTAAHEGALHRRRRRLLAAVAGAVVASLAATWGIEQIQHEGVTAMLPTRVILVSLPLVGGAHEGLTAELTTRMGRRRLGDTDYRTLIKRCLRGDPWARPVTAAWEAKYGGLLDQCRDAAPEDIDLERRLLALPARIELGTRQQWPRDAPVCLDLDVQHWWTPGTSCRIRLTPKWGGAEPVTIVASGASLRPRPFPLVIDPPPDAAALDFDLELERRLPSPQATWEHMQEVSISVPLALEGSLAEAMQPAEDEDLHDAVVSTFNQGVIKWTGGRSPVRVRFTPYLTRVPELEDTAIGACVEILRDGILARRLDLWWPARPGAYDEGVGWRVDYEDVELLMEANETDGHWQMRVRGDPAIALRAGAGTRYWAGEFTVPLTVNEVPTPAPAKDWWVELDK
jgi:hypothetical protein